MTIPERPSWFQCTLKDLLDEFVRPECIEDVTCDRCSVINGKEYKSTYTKQLTLAKVKYHFEKGSIFLIWFD